MNEIDPQKEKKTVRIFSIASFLNDLGSDIIYPIWPTFLTEYLKANMTIVGLIDGLGDAILSISQALSGYLSDKFRKRKIFIWLGYLFGAISRIGYALSTSYHPVLFFRILDRSGKIRSAPRDALIADVSSDQTRGKNFGILRSMDNLGAVVGIILCMILFPVLGYKYLFLLAAIPSLIGVIIILIFLKEEKFQSKVFKGYSLKYLDKNLKILFWISAIFSLGSFSYSFLLVFANKNGFPIYSLPILYLIFTFFASMFSFYFGKLSDKIGRKKVLMFAFILWIISIIILISFPFVAGFILSFVFYGLHKAAFEPVHKTLISELSPVEYRASILGGFQMIIGLFAFPASFLAGILWDRVNIFAPFYFSIVLTLLSIALLLRLKENR
ncbi:MAG: MFS transporter [Ignavibacteria bacterium]|jgi:MFS family permease|nr:MFS transporter [Ignavibacteria bacterium]MDH7527966.1 MFS transporter [Ignavibacteria bacterium]